MNLIHKIEEQFSISFTGRINVLGEENSQFIGVVLISEGDIVKCRYRERRGEQALLHLIVADVTSKEDFRFIVEPEMISKEECSRVLDFASIKKKASDIVQKFATTKNLSPPTHLKLLVNPHFVSEGQDISTTEFRVMCTMTEYPQVGDIYNALDLHEYEVVEALVSLRKKKAIRVSGRSQAQTIRRFGP